MRIVIQIWESLRFFLRIRKAVRKYTKRFKSIHGGQKGLFFPRNCGTFEPVVWCGWRLLKKCRILVRLSYRLGSDFWRWQMCCWGCHEGTSTWITRYFPPKMIQNFPFLTFLRFRRLHLTCSEELRNWGFVGGSIDSLTCSCIFQWNFWYFLKSCPVLNNNWPQFDLNTKFQPLEITMLAKILENVSKNHILSKIHMKRVSACNACGMKIFLLT
jgi:hypothetical protein